EFSGEKKFILAVFYIHLFIGIFTFLFQLSISFWQPPFQYFSYESFALSLSVIFLVIVTFLVKSPILRIPFRIYGLVVLFLFVLNIVYTTIIVPHNLDLLTHPEKKNYYKLFLGILWIIPQLSLLYILIR